MLQGSLAGLCAVSCFALQCAPCFCNELPGLGACFTTASPRPPPLLILFLRALHQGLNQLRNMGNKVILLTFLRLLFWSCLTGWFCGCQTDIYCHLLLQKRSIATGLGLTAASMLMAQNADAAADVAQIAQKAGDNRILAVAALLTPALGWVLFNIGVRRCDCPGATVCSSSCRDACVCS